MPAGTHCSSPTPVRPSCSTPSSTPGRACKSPGRSAPTSGKNDVTIPEAEATSKALWALLQEDLQDTEYKGLQVIGAWVHGPGVIHAKEAVRKLEDMKGMKFRVMQSDMFVDMVSALGANATPLPYGEVYSSIQTGVIDAQENPLDIIQAMKFFEVQKNLLVTDHGAIVECILFSPRFWQRLSAAQRDVIRAAFREVAPEVDRGKEADAQKSLAFFKTAGLNVRIADEAERARLRAIVYPAGRDAYVAQAGAEGKALIALYEKELQALGK